MVDRTGGLELSVGPPVVEGGDVVATTVVEESDTAVVDEPFDAEVQAPMRSVSAARAGAVRQIARTGMFFPIDWLRYRENGSRAG
ncbi:MAG: hypothetical protein HKN91_01820 [Acidimicrobiia bacterium]|nr:hypothetical protein [Acidimicrobiia bacterium]